jgi:hypothetical protein
MGRGIDIMTKRPLRCLFIVCACLLVTSTTPKAVTIDAFTDLLPSNPGLPVSGRPIIFVGTMCDGGACPPGSFVSHLVSDAAYETGLAGVLGGVRLALITYVVGTADALIYNGLSFNHDTGASAILELRYGPIADLNADLTLYGGTRFDINLVSGDMYAGPRPVPCTVTVTSGRGTPRVCTASVTRNLIDDGVYAYSFASFTGVDFTDVDAISVVFDASRVTAVDFALGAFKTDGGTVPTRSSTWGAIKSLWE